MNNHFRRGVFIAQIAEIARLADKSMTIVLGILIILLGSASWGQTHRHIPSPPSGIGSPDENQPQAAPKPQPKVNRAELEKHGRELAELASTIPADIQQVNKGLLPKDMVVKLKRIEKLSKQLRGEISP